MVKDCIADAFLQNILLYPQDYDVVCAMNLNGDYISDALAAEVVDNGSEPLENTVYSQGFIFPSKIKFINKAEKRAETLNDLNQRLSKYTEAVEDDYLTAIEKESAGGMDIEA